MKYTNKNYVQCICTTELWHLVVVYTRNCSPWIDCSIYSVTQLLVARLQLWNVNLNRVLSQREDSTQLFQEIGHECTTKTSLMSDQVKQSVNKNMDEAHPRIMFLGLKDGTMLEKILVMTVLNVSIIWVTLFQCGLMIGPLYEIPPFCLLRTSLVSIMLNLLLPLTYILSFWDVSLIMVASREVQENSILWDISVPLNMSECFYFTFVSNC